MQDRKSEEQKKIILCHLKQLHKHPLPDTLTEHPVLQDMIINSQWQITEFLLKNNPDIIISEGIETPLTLETIPDNIITQIKLAFPNGLPKYDTALTWEQRKCFYEFHADTIIVALGIVNKIYPATDSTQNIHAQAVLSQQVMIMSYIDHEVKNKERLVADQSIASEMKLAAIEQASKDLTELVDMFNSQHQMLFLPREMSAINNLKAAVEDASRVSDKSCYNAALIFGGRHDFKPVCASEGIELSEIDTYDLAQYEQILQQISAARVSAKRMDLKLFERDHSNNQRLDLHFQEGKHDKLLKTSLQKFLDKKKQNAKEQKNVADDDKNKRNPKIC